MEDDATPIAAVVVVMGGAVVVTVVVEGIAVVVVVVNGRGVVVVVVCGAVPTADSTAAMQASNWPHAGLKMKKNRSNIYF